MQNIYLIKDVAAKTGLSVYTVKYYIKLGLIKEFGRSPVTNFRYFDDRTIERLLTIRRLRKARMTMDDIKKVLRQR